MSSIKDDLYALTHTVTPLPPLLIKMLHLCHVFKFSPSQTFFDVHIWSIFSVLFKHLKNVSLLLLSTLSIINVSTFTSVCVVPIHFKRIIQGPDWLCLFTHLYQPSPRNTDCEALSYIKEEDRPGWENIKTKQRGWWGRRCGNTNWHKARTKSSWIQLS